MKPLLLFASLALSVPALAGDTRVVCSTGTTPFQTIQAAVDASADGDVVVVRRHWDRDAHYAGFTVDGKGLTIVGVDPSATRVRDVVVRDVPLGSTVTLEGLDIEGASGPSPTTPTPATSGVLTVTSSEGAVRVSRCSVAAGGPVPAVWASLALDLTFVDCELFGGTNGLGEPALVVRASRVAAYRSQLVGGPGAGQIDYFGDLVGETGGAGADVGQRSFLWLGASGVTGGMGGQAECIFGPFNCSSLTPGDGGPGLVTDASSLTVRLETAVSGGAPGITNGFTPAEPGPDEVGLSTHVPGEQRVLNVARSVRSGDLLTVRVEGTPGENVELQVARDGWHRYFGPLHGVYSTRTPAPGFPVALGAIPTSGVLEASIALPLALPLEARTFALQATARTGPGRFRLTHVATVTVLGDGAPALEPGGVVYVDAAAAAAAAGGHGGSWGTAMSDLRTALLASPPASEGAPTEVWVAAGDYRLAGPGGAAGRYFEVPHGVRLRGGFAGFEATPLERDLAANRVVLDGDLLGDDVSFAFGGGGRTDNSFRVVVLGTLGPLSAVPEVAASLEDVVVRGAGNANAVPFRGGGVVGSGFLRLLRCELRDNECAGDGAGAELRRFVEVRHCTFVHNRAGREGGGLSLYTLEQAAVFNCLFVANRAGEEGAGLNVEGGGFGNPNPGHVDVLCSTFYENRGGLCPGALEVAAGVSTRAVDNVFWSNGHAVSASPCEIRVALPFEVRYNVIRAVPALWSGNGNLDLDPLFVDPLGPDGVLGTVDDDLRLSPGSPAIDAGDSFAVPAVVQVDLDGAPRFADHLPTPTTGIGGTRVVDMGAYERQ